MFAKITVLIFLLLLVNLASCQSNNEFVNGNSENAEMIKQSDLSFLGIYLSVWKMETQPPAKSHQNSYKHKQGMVLKFSSFEIYQHKKENSSWYSLQSPDIKINEFSIEDPVLLLLAEVPDGVYSKLKFILEKKSANSFDRRFSNPKIVLIQFPQKIKITNGQIAEIKLIYSTLDKKKKRFDVNGRPIEEITFYKHIVKY